MGRAVAGAALLLLGSVFLLLVCPRVEQGISRRLGLWVGPTAGPFPAGTCEKLACPEFRSVHEEADFQIREYSAAKWAETDPLLDASFVRASSSGFRSLFEYIQGKNEDGVQIPMTAPVLTTIQPGEGPFCSSSFSVRFFVPPLFTNHTPAPSPGLGVHILPLPLRCVAVRRFPGFASDLNVAQEAQLLAESLQRTPWANISSLQGRTEAYAIAQYNSPFELFNRVNEVWAPFAPQEGQPDCTPAALGPPLLRSSS